MALDNSNYLQVLGKRMVLSGTWTPREKVRHSHAWLACPATAFVVELCFSLASLREAWCFELCK